MEQKAIQKDTIIEQRIQHLCRALEEGGTKIADDIIAFSKNNPGKH